VRHRTEMADAFDKRRPTYMLLPYMTSTKPGTMRADRHHTCSQPLPNFDRRYLQPPRVHMYGDANPTTSDQEMGET
jgi:hypothetical protein